MTWLKHALDQWHRLFRHKALGVHVDDQTLFVFDLDTEQQTIVSLDTIGADSRDDMTDLRPVFRWLRQHYQSHLSRIVLICSRFEQYDHNDHINISRMGKRFGNQVFFIEARMCVAMGAGLLVEAEQKQVLVLVAAHEIHVLLVFAGGFYHEVRFARTPETDLSQAIEDGLYELKNTLNRELPERFQRARLPPAYKDELARGWEGPYHEQVHVVFLDSQPQSMPEMLAGHPITAHDDGTACIRQGLANATRNLFSPATRRAMIKILQAGLRFDNETAR